MKKLENTVCMDSDEINRCLKRIAHQILENNNGCEDLAIVGIVSRGNLIASRLANLIFQIENTKIETGSLDISFYRDDFAKRINPTVLGTNINFNIDDKKIVLVDDVLYTGRTIRSALDALMDIGRPKCVQLAVLIDRGHRELPIRPDYVGKNIPTSFLDDVAVYLEEVDGKSSVELGKNQMGSLNNKQDRNSHEI